MPGVPAVSEAGEERAAGGKVAAVCPCALCPPQVSAVGMRQNGSCRAGPEETPRPAGGRWGASPHALGPWRGAALGGSLFFCSALERRHNLQAVGPTLSPENVVSLACGARKTRHAGVWPHPALRPAGYPPRDLSWRSTLTPIFHSRDPSEDGFWLFTLDVSPRGLETNRWYNRRTLQIIPFLPPL
ncbi:hypothetical protein NDU88_001395 [Pleurodeles waltl]|uniref:Uncharacterized protein n=1 Tax=Pleurodeles waltl TaxID=8319 RepID=A0AAV7U7G2_PLEWA|nr:hypothetical protein NDU88_001395 [Pleurodeles waltl]